MSGPKRARWRSDSDRDGMVPVNFFNWLEGDVVGIAEEEVNGIRGWTLYLEWIDGEELVKISKIKGDPPTCHKSSLLHLRLARAKTIQKPGNL